jgi:hypothetical protein
MRLKTKTTSILIKVSPDEKNKMIERAKSCGFSQLSEFIRIMTLNGRMDIK